MLDMQLQDDGGDRRTQREAQQIEPRLKLIKKRMKEDAGQTVPPSAGPIAPQRPVELGGGLSRAHTRRQEEPEEVEEEEGVDCSDGETVPAAETVAGEVEEEEGALGGASDGEDALLEEDPITPPMKGRTGPLFHSLSHQQSHNSRFPISLPCECQCRSKRYLCHYVRLVKLARTILLPPCHVSMVIRVHRYKVPTHRRRASIDIHEDTYYDDDEYADYNENIEGDGAEGGQMEHTVSLADAGASIKPPAQMSSVSNSAGADLPHGTRHDKDDQRFAMGEPEEGRGDNEREEEEGNDEESDGESSEEMAKTFILGEATLGESLEEVTQVSTRVC